MPSRYSKKIPWLPLIVAAVLVPLLLTALATLTGIGKRDGIQDDLKSRSRQALAEKFPGAQVSFEGRDGTARGIPAGQEQAAKAALGDVDGIRVVNVASTGGGAGDDGGSPLSVSSTPDTITLRGEVPDEATKTELVKTAESKADGRKVDDQLTVKEGAKPSLDAAGVGALVGAAGKGDVNVEADGKKVTLSGSVPSDKAKADVEEQAKKAAPDAEVDNQLTVKGTDKKALQSEINKAIKARGINFQVNSAKLRPESAATLKRIAKALKAAPDAEIRVDGHVAGRHGVRPNPQKLSEQRAATVKRRLIQLGVEQDRISTRGFGGSRPIEDNDTPEGKAANRRVEIKVL